MSASGGTNRLYAGSLRLYGRGGLAISPTDVAILRHIISGLPGVSDLQLLEDERDVDMTFALARSDALGAYAALVDGLHVAIGHATCRSNITTLKMSVLEVS